MLIKNVIWFVFLGFIVGTILGSFAKAVSDRQQKCNNNLRGRSYCENCKHKLVWYDLFPVVSYILLSGKCRYCQQKIPLSNLLAEIIMGVLIATLFASQSFNFSLSLNPNLTLIIPLSDLIFKIFIITVLFILFLTDLKTGLLPDKITYPVLSLALAYLFIINIFESWLFYGSLKVHALGKYFLPPYSNYVWSLIYRIWEPAFLRIFLGLSLSLFFALLIIITKGKGMGWGDVKFVLFLGIALGFPNAIIGIFLSFLLGASFSIILIISGKKHFGETIPFGPFLSLGAYIALIWGSQITEWYLKMGIK